MQLQIRWNRSKTKFCQFEGLENYCMPKMTMFVSVDATLCDVFVSWIASVRWAALVKGWKGKGGSIHNDNDGSVILGRCTFSRAVSNPSVPCVSVKATRRVVTWSPHFWLTRQVGAMWSCHMAQMFVWGVRGWNTKITAAWLERTHSVIWRDLEPKIEWSSSQISPPNRL